MPTALARLTVPMPLLLRFALPAHARPAIVVPAVVARGVAVRRGAGGGLGRGFADGAGRVVDAADFRCLPPQSLIVDDVFSPLYPPPVLR